jgi:WD40 domain-containing protein
MRATFVALALCLAACSEPPPPVTAVRVLEVTDLQPVVNAVALSPDGGLVVVGDLDGGLIAREVPSGAERWKIRVHSRGSARRIDGVFFSPDGSLLVTTGHDARTLDVWDAATGQSASVLDIGQSRGVAFHPTERMLAVAAAASIHVVDLDRGEVVRSLPNAHAADPVYAIAFAGDGQVLASISERGSLKLWSWPALVLRSSAAVSGGLESVAPVSLALTRHGTRAAANGILGRVHVVDSAKGREERTFANAPEAPGHAMHAELRYSLAFTEDGDWLFAPDTHDRGLRILHVPSGKTYPVLHGEGPFYKAVALALPGSMVAFLRPGDGEGRGPYGLEVWRLNYQGKPR